MGVVRVLLEHGVDANVRDADNATPTHLASCSWYDEENLLGVLRLLLQYGSDIHAFDNKGQTPFMRATEGKRPIMQFLLENGAEDHRKVMTDDHYEKRVQVNSMYFAWKIPCTVC